MSLQGQLSWVNPSTNTDGSAFSAATDLAGIQIEFDAAPVVSVPVSFNANTFDLTTLAAYNSLKSGDHTVAISVVNTAGSPSALSPSDTFSIAVVPNAPSGLAIR